MILNGWRDVVRTGAREEIGASITLPTLRFPQSSRAGDGEQSRSPKAREPLRAVLQKSCLM